MPTRSCILSLFCQVSLFKYIFLFSKEIKFLSVAGCSFLLFLNHTGAGSNREREIETDRGRERHREKERHRQRERDREGGGGERDRRERDPAKYDYFANH